MATLEELDSWGSLDSLDQFGNLEQLDALDFTLATAGASVAATAASALTKIRTIASAVSLSNSSSASVNRILAFAASVTGAAAVDAYAPLMAFLVYCSAVCCVAVGAKASASVEGRSSPP